MAQKNYGDGKQALIEATVRVIGDHGWAGLTNRRVAALAGVNNTLITHHFGSQEEMIAEAARWATDTSIQRANLAAVGRLNESYADSLLRLVSDDPTIQAFQLELILASRRDPTLRPIAERLYKSYLASAEVLLGDSYGIAPDQDLARVVFAALEGLVFQLLTVVSPDAVRRSIGSLDAVINVYARAVSTQRSPVAD